MPSPRHDTLNLLFQDNPGLAVTVLRELMGFDLPAGAPVRKENRTFNDRPSKDLHPDNVVTVGPPQAPVHGIVVEIQQDISDDKRRQLPRYAASLWLLLECPVTTLVVCPQGKAAAWYADPVHTNLPGYVFRAAVLGPDRIPAITDALAAAAQPELAAMSVMVHGQRREVAEAFVAGLGQLNDEHAPHYYEYAYAISPQAVQSILEEIMASSTWPVYSPFAREHFGRGEAKGREEGRMEEAVRMIRLALEARGVELSEQATARITACTDLDQLETWARRAVTAETADDLFA
jgi:hypothetical protein